MIDLNKELLEAYNAELSFIESQMKEHNGTDTIVLNNLGRRLKVILSEVEEKHAKLSLIVSGQ